ncbi:MAG: helix-turn-helix domain-containing protein [Rickettsiales bacterium]|jgi:hypothetical protein|nr:helix-turn-helix domain-containing protein [Rickettsiales bacterium]
MPETASYIRSPRTIKEYHIVAKLYEADPHLREKKFDIKKTAATYRSINYWESVGVLDDPRNVSGHGWRKFSSIDTAFIAIITQLRAAGFSIEKIKQTKESLFAEWIFPEIQGDKLVVGISETSITALEFAFQRMLLGKQFGEKLFTGNVYLIIDDDGRAEVMMNQDFLINRSLGLLPHNYYILNLNALFSEYISDTLVKIWDEKTDVLDDNESVALNTIRAAGNDETITLKRDGKKITLIERKFSSAPSGELHNLIDEIKYGELTIKIRNGKPVIAHAIKQEKIGNAE